MVDRNGVVTLTNHHDMGLPEVKVVKAVSEPDVSTVCECVANWCTFFC